jgi:hypothetical protein
LQNLLTLRLKQMHAALAATKSSDLSGIEVRVSQTSTFVGIEIDFTSGADAVDLANQATLLTNNVASLKDHLKIWCGRNGAEFRGDALINSNKSVALIHDLWNVDKHVELRTPRSGSRPALRNLRTTFVLSSGEEPGSSVRMTLDMRSGTWIKQTRGGGDAGFALTGEIVDGNGAVVGEYLDTCKQAISAWEATLRTAGVAVP